MMYENIFYEFEENKWKHTFGGVCIRRGFRAWTAYNVYCPLHAICISTVRMTTRWWWTRVCASRAPFTHIFGLLSVWIDGVSLYWSKPQSAVECGSYLCKQNIYICYDVVENIHYLLLYTIQIFSSFFIVAGAYVFVLSTFDSFTI